MGEWVGNEIMPAYTGQHLNKDYASRKSTDLLVTFPGDDDQWPTAMDYTCLCPHLPKYRAKALKDFMAMIDTRARDKTKKHAEYCHRERRTFIPIPGTTHGSTGTAAYWDLIDAAWARATRRDPHGTKTHTHAENKQAFMARLHAILINYTADHVAFLSRGT